MQYDERKIEETVLALLGALEFEDGRVWKRYDFRAMEALHEKGYITDPHGKQQSVNLTNDGIEVAKRLAHDFFGVPGAAAGKPHR